MKSILTVLLFLVALQFVYAQSDQVRLLTGKLITGEIKAVDNWHVRIDNRKVRFDRIDYIFSKNQEYNETFNVHSKNFWLEDNNNLQAKRNYMAGQKMIKFSHYMYFGIGLGIVGGVLSTVGAIKSNNTLIYTGAGIGGAGFVSLTFSFTQLGRAGQFLRGPSR